MSANVQRPYLTQDGMVKMVDADWCRCGPQKGRGPLGGVCGRCGGAIPDRADDILADVVSVIDKGRVTLASSGIVRKDKEIR